MKTFYAFYRKQLKSMIKYDNLVASIVVILVLFFISPKIKNSELFLANKSFFFCIFQTFLAFYFIFGNSYSSFLEERLDKKTDIVCFYSNSFNSIITGISTAICLSALLFSFIFTFILRIILSDFSISTILYSYKEILYCFVCLPSFIFIFTEIEGLFVFNSSNPKTSEMYINFILGLFMLFIVFISLFAYSLYERHILIFQILLILSLVLIITTEFFILKKINNLKFKELEDFHVIE